MPPPSTDWISYLERLSSAGFGVVAGLLLVGSFFGIWIWGRHHREYVKELKENHADEIAELRRLHAERVTELSEDIRELKASKQRWEDMSLGLLNPLERTVEDRLSRKRG